jgi:hypothetical protein
LKRKDQGTFFEYESGFEETEKPAFDWGPFISEIESIVDERDCLKCTTHKRINELQTSFAEKVEEKRIMRKKPRAAWKRIEEYMLSMTKKREELAVAMADLECRVMKRYADPAGMNIYVPSSGVRDYHRHAERHRFLLWCGSETYSSRCGTALADRSVMPYSVSIFEYRPMGRLVLECVCLEA